MYKARGKGKITPGDKILIVTKRFYYLFIQYNLKISALSRQTFWENNFSTFSLYISTGTRIWPCRRPCRKKIKGHSRSIIWTNFGRPWCFLPRFTLKTFLLLEKSIFNKFMCFFHHIQAWWPSCSKEQNHLNKLIIPLWQKAPYDIWWKIVKLFQKRRRLKIMQFYTRI